MTVGTVGVPGALARVAAELHEDLLTDWIPDPVGAWGLEQPGPPREEFGGRLEIETRAGRRAVPVPSLECRAWALAETDKALGQLEGNLGQSVYGYRDALTPYRDEWARLAADQARHWKASSFCLRLDVNRFFESVDVALVSSALPDDVVTVVSASQNFFEQALIPGHRWSRRVANVLLRSLDGCVLDGARGRIQRWQDDYWIFADSETEARQWAQKLHESLSSAGLVVTSSKFGRVLGGPLVEEGDLTLEAAYQLADEALRNTDLSPLKYLMRWFSERSIAEPLPRFGEAASRSPVLTPRLAAWIANCRATPEAEQALKEGLQGDDLWVLCRLTAAACHSERLTSFVTPHVLEVLADSDIAAARGLAARIQGLRGLTRVPASPRIDAVLGRCARADLLRALPLVATTL
jgi:hypothetical protein